MKIYIYSLSDSNSVFYIGQTKNTKIRLSTHISSSRLLKNDKDAIIRDIIKEGRVPILTVLKECLESDANEVEAATIMEHFNSGHTLLNSVISRAKRIIDYKNKKLSIKEIKLINLMANDFTTEEIAEQLMLSVRTIETIRRKVKDKLKCKTISGMMITALQNNYLTIQMPPLPKSL